MKNNKVYSFYLSEKLMDEFQMICAINKTKQSNQLENIIRDYVAVNKQNLIEYVTNYYTKDNE